ncbi:MAG TPA: spermidine synthase [Aquabacterium sp.]|uniref:spermine/spermidine synthase domain-containing protein n=1 Tax=Aquabacterium sp. TaxID=1872578 RepID=UPI002E35234A|nr:spermidine synthase [Aquabacterium sp.]HEX5372725.1 spermidine synthase [Aquabacterium sp.]
MKAPAKKKLKLPDATISEEGGLRYLHLETPWIQGAMRIRKPLKLELDYIQRMMAWLLLRDPRDWASTRTLQLGLGSGAITKYCHSVLRVPTTTVEINPKVIQVCRVWFHLPEDDERLTVCQDDAARFVNDPEQVAQFDALSVDLYDHEAASPVLDDEDFYRACWQVLDDGGVMSVNLFGREASFERSTARIAAAFGAGRTAMLKPTREGNTIVLAWKGFDLPERDVLAARAETLQARFELPARKWVKLLSAFTPAAVAD